MATVARPDASASPRRQAAELTPSPPSVPADSEETDADEVGAGESSPGGGHSWTLLTSHGRVLLLIAREPDIRLRDIAYRARITERTASGIVSDLENAGYLTRARHGRRNTYVVHSDREFRHPAEASHTVGELIEVFRSR